MSSYGPVITKQERAEGELTLHHVDLPHRFLQPPDEIVKLGWLLGWINGNKDVLGGVTNCLSDKS